MIKIVFNFKYIYTYALMHVLYHICFFFFNNLTNYLYFYNKNYVYMHPCDCMGYMLVYISIYI